MLEEVKPKTLDDKFEEMKKALGQAFFDYGRTQYEIEVKQKEHNEVGIRLHNLNEAAKALQKQMAKEKIAEESAKISLASPASPLNTDTRYW